MATVVLIRPHLHDAADPAVFLALYSRMPIETVSKRGEVRQYAAGRVRSIVRVGRRRTLPLEFVDLTDSDLATLEDWIGRLLMYRDPAGRKVFGSYFSIDPRELKGQVGWSVALTFHEVTHSEEV